jgi:hypothetical protein
VLFTPSGASRYIAAAVRVLQHSTQTAFLRRSMRGAREAWSTAPRQRSLVVFVVALVFAAFNAGDAMASPSGGIAGTVTNPLTNAPIISEGVAWEVGNEVLVGAHINPEGLETTYEIQVECPDHAMCQATAGPLPAVDEARAVHLALNEPQRGGTYIFTVTARNVDGKASASWRFQVPSPPTQEIPPGAAPNGSLDTEAYRPPELPWANQSGNEGAGRTVAEQRTKEKTEQQARETAASRAAEALTHAVEAAQPTTSARQRPAAKRPACTVPALKSDTLGTARRTLVKAHCRLGKVSRPRGHHKTLVVAGQGTKSGKTLADGSAIAVKLARIA